MVLIKIQVLDKMSVKKGSKWMPLIFRSDALIFPALGDIFLLLSLVFPVDGEIFMLTFHSFQNDGFGSVVSPALLNRTTK